MDRFEAKLRDRIEKAQRESHRTLLDTKDCTCSEPGMGQCDYHNPYYDHDFGFTAGANFLLEYVVKARKGLEFYADKENWRREEFICEENGVVTFRPYISDFLMPTWGPIARDKDGQTSRNSLAELDRLVEGEK